MRYLKTVLFSAICLFATLALAKPKTTYFSCVVNEPPRAKNGKKIAVTVKFAIEGLDTFKGKGELAQYPDSNEDEGPILVTPQTNGKSDTLMMNLNAQGGDLRIESPNIRLFGDGAGYQFTDLVVWDVEDESNAGELEGYVRDYGPAYSAGTNPETFKQFIKCRISDKVL